MLPVTHTAPRDPEVGIEIPPGVKRHLGLDGERSWVILDEVNSFLWPAFDLRPIPGTGPACVDSGVLPGRFFDRVRESFVGLYRQRRVKVVPRT